MGKAAILFETVWLKTQGTIFRDNLLFPLTNKGETAVGGVEYSISKKQGQTVKSRLCSIF